LLPGHERPPASPEFQFRSQGRLRISRYFLQDLRFAQVVPILCM
jgi:hypothetical protein